ncbi:trypsin-like peptidase domain-containing protein (plasmid) [Bradyrhizobium barranii subsp. apii]|uniref:Trypsin-like peptidase domain-containing protein n=1 Tax=Bradyrhizobium barranii subsp. apii TaxID=2819348 RepID=A0A8U0FXV7_9BRAD|nr:trypsin-like peptidase domain-containing protein [Bradyrhizobium barranii]UPT92462.1 trypsin-like peptidase domain-containing protein [Bradyrhizobium barranii subsp. apii]
MMTEASRIDAGLVQIVTLDEGKPFVCGMGLLVSSQEIVTCAHVVNIALHREPMSRASPIGEFIWVSFPRSTETGVPPARPLARASVQEFEAPGREPDDDVALLLLDVPAEETIGFGILADIQGIDLVGSRVSVFGARAGPLNRSMPIHTDGRYVGATNQSFAQIEPVTPVQSFVEPGYSGGRVWSEDVKAAIGMIVARLDNQNRKIAFFLPAHAIASRFRGIPIETRQMGMDVAALFRLAAIGNLILVLAQFLANRIDEFDLAFGGGNPVLNAFWGLLLNPLMMPVSFWALWRYARNYSEHPWWQRIPTILSIRGSRIGAVLSILFFVLAPLYMQCFFADQFRSYGFVYIDKSKIASTGETLTDCVGNWCLHPGVTRWSRSLSTNASDSTRYGHLKADKAPAAVTYFPAFEPIGIAAFTGVGLVLAILAILAIFRVPRRLLSRAAR